MAEELSFEEAIEVATTKRSCCASYVNEYHTIQCEHYRSELAPLWKEGGYQKTSFAGKNMAITPFNADGSLDHTGRVLIGQRECCLSWPGEVHQYHCASHYFVDGQVVVKASNFNTFPDGKRLHVMYDTVSNDRTFENETRLH